MGSNLERKLRYVYKKNEWELRLMKNLDNECDVKLHFKTSYYCNLWHLISNVLTFKNSQTYSIIVNYN